MGAPLPTKSARGCNWALGALTAGFGGTLGALTVPLVLKLAEVDSPIHMVVVSGHVKPGQGV